MGNNTQALIKAAREMMPLHDGAHMFNGAFQEEKNRRFEALRQALAVIEHQPTVGGEDEPMRLFINPVDEARFVEEFPGLPYTLTKPLPTRPAPVVEAREAFERLINAAEFTLENQNLCPHSRDYLESALAALQSPAREGWRPIASAPRDGTRILAYWPCMRITEYPAVIYVEEGEFTNIKSWNWTNNMGYGEEEAFPTHWMPLPLKPNAGEV